jgi:hypothetical protein
MMRLKRELARAIYRVSRAMHEWAMRLHRLRVLTGLMAAAPSERNFVRRAYGLLGQMHDLIAAVEETRVLAFDPVRVAA